VLWSTVADMDRTSQPIGPLGRPALPTVPMRLSIGMASLPDDGMQRQDLLVTADARMYEAKAARRWIDLGTGSDTRQMK
jgi:GGDEF domain-containing protein